MIGTTLIFKRKVFNKPSITDVIALFILLSYIIGFVIGLALIISCNQVFLGHFEKVFYETLIPKSNYNFFLILLFDFLKFLPFLLSAYFLGTSIIGCVLIPAVNIFKGMYDGLLLCYIYSTFKLIGMGFSALIYVPGNVVFVFIIILCTRESVCFSDRVLKNAMPKGTSLNLSYDFKIYTIRYLVLCSVSLIAAFINAATSKLFFEYFSNSF